MDLVAFYWVKLKPIGFGFYSIFFNLFMMSFKIITVSPSFNIFLLDFWSFLVHFYVYCFYRVLLAFTGLLDFFFGSFLCLPLLPSLIGFELDLFAF